jgi:purine-binding chemotaxis protein CheW
MSIDWDELRQGLHNLRLSLSEDGAHGNAVQQQQILAERARNLAQRSASAADQQAQAQQVLEVVLAGVRYAFELKYLVEVLPWKPLTPVPGTPPWVLGMLLTRGRVVSCVDLLTFLGLPVMQLVEPTGIVVLADGDMEIGLPVQQVGSMERAPEDAVAARGQLPDKVQQMLLGVTPGGAFVLDAARLLADPKLPILG